MEPQGTARTLPPLSRRGCEVSGRRLLVPVALLVTLALGACKRDRAEWWEGDADAIRGAVAANKGVKFSVLIETLRTIPNNRLYRALEYMRQDGEVRINEDGTVEIVK